MLDDELGGRSELRDGESLVDGNKEEGIVGRSVIVRFSLEKSDADLSVDSRRVGTKSDQLARGRGRLQFLFGDEPCLERRTSTGFHSLSPSTAHSTAPSPSLSIALESACPTTASQ